MIRSIIGMIVAAGLAATAGAVAGFYLRSMHHTTTPGSSQKTALDLVSGDISVKSRGDILAYLGNLTATAVTNDSFTVRDYKKIYNDEYLVSYTVQFVADVATVKSSYLVTSQVVDGHSLGIQATCAPNQKPGYTCSPPDKGGD
jgi:hypothetical protein